MASNQPGGDEPSDLAVETRAWAAWNASVYARSRPAGVETDLAARTSLDRSEAVLARAQTIQALLSEQGQPSRHDQLTAVHAATAAFFQAQLPGSWVPSYLTDRGMQAVFLPTSPWKIGYAPRTWTALTRHLQDQGFGDDLLLASGLCVAGQHGGLRDRFCDRLMIPLRSPNGTVIAFIGRRHPAAADAHGPKYLNSPDTDLFVKGHVLCGLAEGRRQLDLGAQPVLVEGPLDAIAVSIAAPGRFVGVAPCGTALTGDQVAALARAVDLPNRGVRVALDADSAGRKAAARAYERLRVVASDIKAVIFADGQDPAGTLEGYGRDRLREALTYDITSLADLVVDVRIEEWAGGKELQFVEERLGAIRAAATVISGLPGGEVGPQTLRLAKRFDWDHETVTEIVIQAIERRYEAMPTLPASSRASPSQPDPYAKLPDATTQIAQRACASSALSTRRTKNEPAAWRCAGGSELTRKQACTEGRG
jgi:DNA primase